MKKCIIATLACTMFLGCAGVTLCSADQYVKGYTRSNGTYVEGYHRTSPNSTTSDNYSTKGNVNPYTGEKGYKN